MTGGLVPAGVFCLAAGAALGCLFLLCKALRLALGLGPWATALVDVLFCLVCGAVSFLCALAVDQGRLRLFQAVFQGLGAWAAIAGLDPLAAGAARAAKGFFRRGRAVLREGKTFGLGHSPAGAGQGSKNRKKFREKPEKAKKKT